MGGNTIGHILQLTTFGESHGEAMGGILTGLPAGLVIDPAFIQAEMDRRKPGQSAITTQRKESDTVKLLSGIFEDKTTGTPIGFIIPNEDQRSPDYEHLKDTYRPSHADYTYEVKYGLRDYRGGGRASARETACRVAAGALAKIFLTRNNIRISAYVSQVGKIKLEKNYSELDLSETEKNIVRCPDAETAQAMIGLIEETRKQGDSLGGIITCIIRNVPAGLGEPVFNKLHADLGHAMLGINAVKGFEYGMGFEGIEKKGSEVNDIFEKTGDHIRTKTNHSGGIQGGISNGMDILFRVAFKPVATILQPQPGIDKDGNEKIMEGKGRHDPCVVPRAVPIVEAMAALVIADHQLMARTNKL